MAKVKLGFSKLTVPSKIQTARTIVTDTTRNTSFPLAQVMLPPITTAVNNLEAAHTAAAGGDHSKHEDMVTKEKVLDGLISLLSDHINAESGGDATKILSTGCQVRNVKSRGKRKQGVERGTHEGEADCTATKVKGAFYRWQYCPDPPPNESPSPITPVAGTPPLTGKVADANTWTDDEPTHEITTTISGLPSGTKMWFRYAPVLSKKNGGQQAWVVLGYITIP